VAYSVRASTAEAFPAWSLSKVKGQFYNHGAPQGIQNATDPTLWDFFAFTVDDEYGTHIRFVENQPRNPDPATSYDVPSPVDASGHTQDNPHVEYSGTVGDTTHLVLFFENYGDLLGGAGGHDIWYTTTTDGTTWTDPANVTSVNTAGDDIQPHLYNDGTHWWLYWTTANNSVDGKLGIFRAQQGTPGDWDSWGTPEQVVSSGTAQAVGEPTLTANGDLSFVVVTKNPDGTAYDQYDADPWFMPHK
jgi:hypothetical protein